MKLVHQITTIALSLAALSLEVVATEDGMYLDGGTIVPINVDQAEIVTNANYPGYRGRTDCFSLVTSKAFWDIDHQKLAMQIIVEDRASEPGQTPNLLVGNTDGPLTYCFKDINKYVTQVRIRTKDGSTLRQAVERSLSRSEDSAPVVVGFVRNPQAQE